MNLCQPETNGPARKLSAVRARGRSQARFRAGAWRLTVEGPPDSITGKRQQVYLMVRAPNSRAGAKAADVELSKLVVEVDAQRVLPVVGRDGGQLMERWVAHRRPGWEERSPGQPDATLARIRKHITPKLGSVAIDRLRPIDVDNLYASWRAIGMAESTVPRDRRGARHRPHADRARPVGPSVRRLRPSR